MWHSLKMWQFTGILPWLLSRLSRFFKSISHNGQQTITTEKATNTIPIIDVSPWMSPDASPEARQAVVHAVRDACVTYGFFQLVGHNIPLDLQDEVFRCAKDLFELPLEEKMKVWIKKSLGMSNRGYETFQGQTLQNGGLPDMKEGFFIGEEISTDDPRAGKFLQGPNQWPAPLPRESFEKPLQDFRSRMVLLAEIVLRIIASGLPSPGTAHFFDNLMIQPSGNLRLLHYPPQTSKDKLQMGAGEHTDFGGVTLLMQQPGTSGLQVWYPPTEAWIPVPVMPNSFVVNIGDLVQMWTGGYYRSASHRVINTGDNHRFSAPFFYNGNINLKMTPLGGGPEITVEDHIRGKLTASMKEKGRN